MQGSPQGGAAPGARLLFPGWCRAVWLVCPALLAGGVSRPHGTGKGRGWWDCEGICEPKQDPMVGPANGIHP